MSESSSEASSSPSTVSRSASPQAIVPKQKRKHEDLEVDSDGEDSSSEPEVPALSHAEKRRQRKLEKLKKAGETSITPDRKKQKLVDGPSAAFKKEKRQNSVWVGNLAFKTTPDALRGFFDGVGEITRIHMPMKAGAKDTNMG